MYRFMSLFLYYISSRNTVKKIELLQEATNLSIDGEIITFLTFLILEFTPTGRNNDEGLIW